MVRMSMKYQRWLQSLLDDLGRGDIGVGNVELSLPRLLFTLHKGRSTLDAWLPVAALFDRTRVMGRLLDIVVQFNRNCWVGTHSQGDTRDHEANYRERAARGTVSSIR